MIASRHAPFHGHGVRPSSRLHPAPVVAVLLLLLSPISFSVDFAVSIPPFARQLARKYSCLTLAALRAGNGISALFLVC
jgi:hypothetical protein